MAETTATPESVLPLPNHTVPVANNTRQRNDKTAPVYRCGRCSIFLQHSRAVARGSNSKTARVYGRGMCQIRLWYSAKIKS